MNERSYLDGAAEARWAAEYYSGRDDTGDREHRLCNATPAAEVVQVIRVTFKRGAGTKDSPVRIVYGYFDFEGHLMAEMDVHSSERGTNA